MIEPDCTYHDWNLDTKKSWTLNNKTVSICIILMVMIKKSLIETQPDVFVCWAFRQKISH